MKKILSFLAAMIIAATTFAKESELNEVTLTTIGTAPSKEQAVNQALRSAIEQAFGTFISANTKIVNDALTKDEIVSLSSGNIKNYEELSCATLSNGNTTVSLRATVSIQKLTTYAKSHGSQCEFAGNTFAQNMKLRELYRQNEAKAIENLLEQLELMMPYAFQYSINITGEPKEYGSSYKVPFSVAINASENSNAAMTLIRTTLSSISLPEQELLNYKSTGSDFCVVKIVSSNPPKPSNNYYNNYHCFENDEALREYQRSIEDEYYFRNQFPTSRLCDILNKAIKFNIYATLDNSRSRCNYEIVDRNGYRDNDYYLAKASSPSEWTNSSVLSPYGCRNCCQWPIKKITIKNRDSWYNGTQKKGRGNKKYTSQRDSQTVMKASGYVIVDKAEIGRIRGLVIEVSR